MAISDDKKKSLIFGFQVNKDFEPKAWLKPRTAEEIASMDDDDFVFLEPSSLKSHALVFAQSGSGKSFAVGRLLEEIVLRTKAKCVVIDPNSDYSRVNTCNESLWDSMGYDPVGKLGPVTMETEFSHFKSPWSRRKVSVFSKRKQGITASVKKDVKLHVSELEPAALFAADGEDNGPEIGACHRFAATLTGLIALNISKLGATLSNERGLNNPKSLLRAIEITARLAFAGDAENFVDYINDNHGSAKEVLARKTKDALTAWNQAAAAQKKADDSVKAVPPDQKEEKEAGLITALQAAVANTKLLWDQYNIALQDQNSFARAVTDHGPRLFRLAKLFSESSLRAYVGKLDYLVEQEYLSGPSKAVRDYGLLAVIDVPTISDQVRQAFFFAVIQDVWRNSQEAWEQAIVAGSADPRTPTFIFIDEAHNIISSDGDPRSLPVKNLVRKIAAEGRKFGIYLVLITQRPDKIDPIIVSECENKLVMRIGSEGVLEESKTVLGFSSEQMRRLSKARELLKGRGFLIGPWSGLGDNEAEQEVYIAARRTQEGGRNLDDGHWGHQDDYPIKAE